MNVKVNDIVKVIKSKTRFGWSAEYDTEWKVINVDNSDNSVYLEEVNDKLVNYTWAGFEDIVVISSAPEKTTLTLDEALAFIKSKGYKITLE